jgi:hypothetical protein
MRFAPQEKDSPGRSRRKFKTPRCRRAKTEKIDTAASTILITWNNSSCLDLNYTTTSLSTSETTQFVVVVEFSNIVIFFYKCTVLSRLKIIKVKIANMLFQSAKVSKILSLENTISSFEYLVLNIYEIFKLNLRRKRD